MEYLELLILSPVTGLRMNLMLSLEEETVYFLDLVIRFLALTSMYCNPTDNLTFGTARILIYSYESSNSSSIFSRASSTTGASSSFAKRLRFWCAVGPHTIHRPASFRLRASVSSS